MIADADTSNLSDSRGSVYTPPYIDVKEAFDATNDPGRLNQQQVLPAAIKGRLMLPVQDSVSLTRVSGAVPNGASAIISSVTKANSGGLVLQSASYQVYIGSVSKDSRMPEAISSSLYPFYVWNSLYDDNYNSAFDNSGMAVSKIQVRNNSGSSQIIVVEAYFRYVINGEGAASLGG